MNLNKLTIKASERRQWWPSGVFIINFEIFSHLVLVFLLLTLSRQMSTGLNPSLNENHPLYLKVPISDNAIQKTSPKNIHKGALEQ